MKKKLNNNIFFLIFFIISIFITSRTLFFSKHICIHDNTHIARLQQMFICIKNFEFPARWSRDFGYGGGMPLFNFYGPFVYYLGVFLYFLLFLFNVDFYTIFKILYILSNILSFVGFYLLSILIFSLNKHFFKKNKTYIRFISSLLSLAFTLAPYRALNLYVRGALSEVWAITLVIWVILFGLSYILDKKKKNFIFFVLFLTFFLLTHNISILIHIPFIFLFFIVFILVYFKKEQYFSKIKDLIIVLFFSFGLSSFFLIPAFLEKSKVYVDFFTKSYYFTPSFHILYKSQFVNTKWGYGGSVQGPFDGMSFFLGFGVLFSILSFLYFIFCLFKNKNKINKKLFIFIIFYFFGFLGLFMTTGKSLFLWNNLPLLSYIQFPWRYLSVVIIYFLLFEIGIIQFCFTKKSLKIYILFLSLISVLDIKYAFLSFKAKQEDSYAFLHQDDKNIIQHEMSDILPDYIPKTVNKSFLSLDKKFEVFEDIKNSFKCKIKEQRSTSLKTFLYVSCSSDSMIPVAFNFLQKNTVFIYVDKKPQSEFYKAGFFILIPLKKGDHFVFIERKKTFIEYMSDGISLFIFIIFIFYLYSYEQNRQK